MRSISSRNLDFLTAWNPSSKLLSRAENQKRNQKLEVFLKEKTFFAGKDIAENEDWEEENYLILDIKLEAAKILGQRFTQNAILFGKIKELPVRMEAQLIYLGRAVLIIIYAATTTQQV